jgi:hypothetical protein
VPLPLIGAPEIATQMLNYWERVGMAEALDSNADYSVDDRQVLIYVYRCPTVLKRKRPI